MCLPPQYFGQQVKNLRKKHGFSQLNLELKLGASTGTISRIENGKINPSKETLFRIAKVFNLTFGEVIILFGIDYFIGKLW